MVSAFFHASSPSLLTAVKTCPTQGFASTSRAMRHLRRSATAPSRHAVLKRSYASHASQNIQSRPSSGAASKSSTTPANPNLERIVTEISQLNLLQAADLVTLLKERLNIKDVVMPMASIATPPPLAAEAPPEEEKPKEKTIFNIVIQAVDASSKAKVIREVKTLVPNLNLMEAKKFVESVPKTVKENLPKDEAEKLKSDLEALGATVVME